MQMKQCSALQIRPGHAKLVNSAQQRDRVPLYLDDAKIGYASKDEVEQLICIEELEL